MKNKVFVIDTNTLISASLFRTSLPRQAETRANRIGKIAASSETYQEFFEVFLRPRFDKYISVKTRLRILIDFKRSAVFTEVSEKIYDCRDPKDNKFLELAVAAKASCVITGDQDLLVLHPFRGIPIFNANDFLSVF